MHTLFSSLQQWPVVLLTQHESSPSQQHESVSSRQHSFMDVEQQTPYSVQQLESQQDSCVVWVFVQHPPFSLMGQHVCTGKPTRQQWPFGASQHSGLPVDDESTQSAQHLRHNQPVQKRGT